MRNRPGRLAHRGLLLLRGLFPTRSLTGQVIGFSKVAQGARLLRTRIKPCGFLMVVGGDFTKIGRHSTLLV